MIEDLKHLPHMLLSHQTFEGEAGLVENRIAFAASGLQGEYMIIWSEADSTWEENI